MSEFSVGISDTMMRELSGVIYKFTYVLIPRGSHDGTNKLRNWDMWGPFLMCLVFGLFINSKLLSLTKDSTQFILLFFSVFVGGMIVTFNIRVLGGQISFFQSVAVLGYCLFPLFAASLIIQIMKLIQFTNKWVRLIIICVACLWCVLCNFISKVSVQGLCGCKYSRGQEIRSNVSDYCLLHIFGCATHVYVIFYFYYVFIFIFSMKHTLEIWG